MSERSGVQRRSGVVVWHIYSGWARIEVRLCGNVYRGYIYKSSSRPGYTGRTEAYRDFEDARDAVIKLYEKEKKT